MSTSYFPNLPVSTQPKYTSQHETGLGEYGAQMYTETDLTRKQLRFSQMSTLLSCLIKSLWGGSAIQDFWSSKLRDCFTPMACIYIRLASVTLSLLSPDIKMRPLASGEIPPADLQETSTETVKAEHLAVSDGTSSSNKSTDLAVCLDIRAVSPGICVVNDNHHSQFRVQIRQSISRLPYKLVILG